jgi:hypothetical protein
VKKYHYIVVGVAAVVAALFLYAFAPGIQKALQGMQLVHKPEALTELSIEDYPSLLKILPAQIESGETVSFSFAIHNAEGQETTYPYIVYIVDAHGTSTISSGTVVLADGDLSVVPVSYTFLSAEQKAVVYVSLIGRDQSVHFSVPPDTSI